MSIRNVARYGTTEVPAIARAQYREVAAADRRQDAVRRAAVRSALPTARIPADEFTRLRKLALAGPTADGDVNAVFFNAARDGDAFLIPFRPAAAAGLAAWMQRADVDFRGDALNTIGAHAAALPATTAITMDPTERRAILRFLDSVASLDVRDASPAADFLRAAKIVDGAVVIRMTAAQAARLSPVLTAAGAHADRIAEVNRIAGRAGTGQH